MNRNSANKHNLLVLVAILLLVAICASIYLWFYPMTQAREETYDAVLLFSDGREPVPCTVRIAGDYGTYYFKNRRSFFRGQMFVDGISVCDAFSMTYDKGQQYAEFTHEGSGYTAVLGLELGEIYAEVFYDTAAGSVLDSSAAETGERCLLVAPVQDGVSAAQQLSNLLNGADFPTDWEALAARWQPYASQ